jgi:hypothetical protein
MGLVLPQNKFFCKPERHPGFSGVLSEPFWKRVPTPPKTFYRFHNRKLLEVQKPFPEKVFGSRRQKGAGEGFYGSLNGAGELSLIFSVNITDT